MKITRETLQLAQNAFWQEIAEGHPEITTGDFAPDAANAFDEACLHAYKTWVIANTPELSSATVEIDDELLIDNKQYIAVGYEGNTKEMLVRLLSNKRIYPLDNYDLNCCTSWKRDGIERLLPTQEVVDIECATYKIPVDVMIPNPPPADKVGESVPAPAEDDGTRYIVVITAVDIHEQGITDEQLAKHCYDIYANIIEDGPLSGDDLGGCGGSIYKTSPTIVDNDKE